MTLPIIPPIEFKERIIKLQEKMASQSIDLMLAFATESEPANTRYFADYWPNFETAAVLVPIKGEALLLIGPEALTYARAHSQLSRIEQLTDFRESSQPDYPGYALTNWKQLFEEFPVNRLGIAGYHLFPHSILQNIKAASPKTEIINGDDQVHQLRIIKTAAEINCLRASAQLSELALKTLLDVLQPGMTEIQATGIAIKAMLQAGAESVGYNFWVASGKNTDQAIGKPTHKKIEKGEMVQLQLGAKVSGYSTAVGRPLVFGTCPEEMRRFMQTGCDAQALTIEKMRAGVLASTVAREVHQFIKEEGFGHTILYGPAHGCGQMECEYPFLETSSAYELSENMTFQSDLFLAQPGMGFRWEDAILVRSGLPAEQLSSYKREVIIL